MLTQKMISSMHGLLIVESMYSDEVELNFTGLTCVCAARRISVSARTGQRRASILACDFGGAVGQWCAMSCRVAGACLRLPRLPGKVEALQGVLQLLLVSRYPDSQLL